MAEKCAITGKKLSTTFLEKPDGTSLRHNGKTYWVCSDVQRQYNNNKERIIEEITKK